jgi:hypothetical protein
MANYIQTQLYNGSGLKEMVPADLEIDGFDVKALNNTKTSPLLHVAGYNQFMIAVVVTLTTPVADGQYKITFIPFASDGTQIAADTDICTAIPLGAAASPVRTSIGFGYGIAVAASAGTALTTTTWLRGFPACKVKITTTTATTSATATAKIWLIAIA